jgi:hypothetical protein
VVYEAEQAAKDGDLSLLVGVTGRLSAGAAEQLLARLGPDYGVALRGVGPAPPGLLDALARVLRPELEALEAEIKRGQVEIDEAQAHGGAALFWILDRVSPYRRSAAITSHLAGDIPSALWFTLAGPITRAEEVAR